MELRLLRSFVVLADELHFGRAALRLQIAQPALTQQIQKLEVRVGAQLFRRTKRVVELTPAGRMLLAEARPLLSHADRAMQSARKAAAGEIGELTIFCGSIASQLVLPGILRLYHRRFPAIGVNVWESHTVDGLVNLDDTRADVGLILPYTRTSVQGRTAAFRVPLLAALPEVHPLRDKSRLTLRQLSHETFLTFPRRQSGVYERVVGLCQRAGFTPRVMEPAVHFWTLMAMIAAGYGVSLVPDVEPGSWGAGVRCVPLREAHATVDICAAWRADPPSRLVAGFLGVVKDYCSDFSTTVRKSR